MHRFFICGHLSTSMRITGQDAIHITRVLRLVPGDLVNVVDSQGDTGLAEITTANSTEVSLILKETLLEQQEASINMYLAQALPKGDKMDLIVQKAVELGVQVIFPIETVNCVVQYAANKKQAKQERWQKIAVAAAKQCKRNKIPQVEMIKTLPQLLDSLPQGCIGIMLYEGQEKQGLKHILHAHKAKDYLLIVGPEGGFSPAEVLLCKQCGLHIAGMGPRILRTETAGLAGIAVIMYEYGDLGG